MNDKLLKRLRNQTVQICDKESNSLGTGFSVDDRLVLTVDHCILQGSPEGITAMKEVLLRRNIDKFVKGIVLYHLKGVAFIFPESPLRQIDRLPMGYCDKLHHGVPVDIYGYPEQEPDGYPLSIEISQNIHRNGDETHPSIKCLVRNVKGALDRYDGLSGSPAVVQDHIVGIVAKEDDGGDEVNAIHIIDFFDIYDAIQEKGISFEKVHIQESGQEQKKYELGRESLYGQAWWIIKKNTEQGVSITISDRYSIILATLLLGIGGKADIILASPWECGLAERLQEETLRYKKEIPGWEGRYWAEYENGTYPDWEIDENISGIIISINAENCNDVLLSGLLTGRRGVQRDILVLWNIWSEHSGQAVFHAVKVAERFYPDEEKDVLTVFASWIKEKGEEKPDHTFLVHETTNAWLKNQLWKAMDWDLFLLGLNTEETDVLAWEFFQYYQNSNMDVLRPEFMRLWEMCSDSVKILSSLHGNEDDLADLRKVEPSLIKRWFFMVKKEYCARILAFLREERNQELYWNAVISNPYCTGDVLQECCIAERRRLVCLILNQNTRIYEDIVLREEAENIRRQIRPI